MTTSQNTPLDIRWLDELLQQIDEHWTQHLRPRLDGLTDEEYLWEPVASWNIRPRGTSTAPVQGGSGEMTIDFAMPEPDPAPFTTIAWRLAHVIVGVLAIRNAGHHGFPGTGYLEHEYAGTAAGALAQLDEQYARWVDGVRAWGEEGLHVPCGAAEGPYAEASRATLVLHISRELIHHGAEIALLRDLYLHTHAR